MHRRMVIALVALVAVLDQLSKALVVATLTPGEPYTILPGFRFYLIRNPGAAFSMGESVTIVFTMIQLAAAILVLMWGHRGTSAWYRVGFGLIGGGALGNVIDRFLREPSWGHGHVVDFISVGNFAIFNLADSAITVGVILYLLGSWLGAGETRRTDKPPVAAPASTTPPIPASTRPSIPATTDAEERSDHA